MQRMKNANHSKPAEAVIQSVEFHPSASVLLTAGFHKTLDLFQVCVTSRAPSLSSSLSPCPHPSVGSWPTGLPVIPDNSVAAADCATSTGESPRHPPPLLQVDGQVNPKLQSIHVEQFPMVTARFSKDGREVVMAGGKRSFYIYDMVAGKVERAFVLSSELSMRV